MLKHYVEYFYPGSFMSESSIEEIPCRGIHHKRKDRAFGYREFSREEITAGTEVLKGEKKDFSGMTYWGKAYSQSQIEALHDPSLSILLGNMKCNRWDRAVKTVLGNWQPLDDRDHVIEEAHKCQH